MEQLTIIAFFISLIIIGPFTRQHQHNLHSHTHRQTYMKKEKFDFFSSPLPRAFDISKIQQHHHLELFDQQALFSTPANNHTLHTPLHIQPFLSCSHKRRNRKNSQDDIFQEHHINLQEESPEEINQKLDFSEQENFLIGITPLKDEKIVDQLEDQTIKKDEKIHDNMSGEVSFNEVGLKNLALQAFKYISHLTKASYKEVAYALITKFNRQQESTAKNVLKRKESNIKRRVYDALNVFIAIGLLQKNGKRIKSYPSYKRYTINNNSSSSKNTTEQLQLELARLKSRCSKKMQSINRKQQVYNLHLQGLTKMKYLRNRNKEMEDRVMTKIIYFPCLLFCKYQERFPIKQQANPQNAVTITQQNDQTLKSTFPRNKIVDLIGDFDIVTYLPIEENKEELPVGKSEKRKKAK